jgi:hypothetical protein
MFAFATPPPTSKRIPTAAAINDLLMMDSFQFNDLDSHFDETKKKCNQILREIKDQLHAWSKKKHAADTW